MQLGTIGHIRDPESIANRMRVDVCITFEMPDAVPQATNTKSRPSIIRDRVSASRQRRRACAVPKPSTTGAGKRGAGSRQVTLAHGRQSP